MTVARAWCESKLLASWMESARSVWLLLVSLDIVWLCWRCFLLVEIREIHLVVDVWE